MHARNGFAIVLTNRGPTTALAIRVIVTLMAGLAAWALGYWLARFAAGYASCAAGRSPSSLGMVLGIACLIAAWSHLYRNAASTRE